MTRSRVSQNQYTKNLMKHMNTQKHTVRLAAAVVALAGSLSLAFAADNILWTWDTALGSWGTAWGQAVTSMDPVEDNTDNGGGSLHVSTDFAGAPPDDNRNVITVMGNHGGWLWNGDVRTNLVEYVSLELDIKWDNASTLSLTNFNSTGGDNGLAVLSVRYTPETEWQWDVTLGTILIPEAAANGWVHISIPIDPVTANLDESAGIMFKKWVPGEVADAGGVASFWIDNVEMIASEVPIEPPTLSVSSDVKEGLNLITLAGSQWQRQGIRTVGTNFSWVGSATPTTYEFTVADVPDTTFAQFQTHIFLVARDPRTGVGPDWDQPDVVLFDMRVLEDGNFDATFRYKTNMPASNTFMFDGEGALGSVVSSTAIGRWGMTFNDDTSITLFSPESTTNLVMSTAAAASFNDGLTVYFGAQPNVVEGIGQKTILAQAKIQGAVGGVDVTDDFAGPLDTSTWEIAAENPGGLVILTDDAAFWVSWTLPDTGFTLQAASEIGAADWVAYAGATAPLPTGVTKSVLVNKSVLPGSDTGYWRLRQREFSKLQILLPGETAAPGTATGKTGTPESQILYANFNITVNAVSDDWALIRNATDTVTLSSTDPDILAEDIALINGTATIVMNMGTAGTQTITVSDVTNPAIASDTSSEFTVNPQ